MTQTEPVETNVSTKTKIWRSVFFGVLCALVYAVAVHFTMPSATPAELFEGGVFLGIFGMVCWLWPWVACFYLLLVGAILAGNHFWESPVGWIGTGVLLFPGLIPSYLFIVPNFIRWVNRPSEDEKSPTENWE